MSAFDRNRIRIALDVAKPFGAIDKPAILDFFTGAQPKIPHARAVQFEIAIFNDGVLDNLSGLTSLRIEFKNVDANGVIDAPGAAQLDDSTGVFNTLLTANEWENDNGETSGKSYHAIFLFTQDQMAGLSMSGAVENEKTFGLVFSGVGAGGGRVDCGVGLVKLVQSGATGVSSGVAPQPTYTFSDQEIEAKNAGKLNAGINAAGVLPIFACRNDATKGMQLIVEKDADGRAVAYWQEVVIPS